MKQDFNKHAGLRVPFFFCLVCHARREAVDEGDPFPVCATCGRRRLETRYEDADVGSGSPAAKRRVSPVPPVDDRPEEAAPITYTKPAPPRVLALEVLTQLVTDLPAGINNPETFRVMLSGGLNRFTREVVNEMVIDQIDWRAALGQLDKEFRLRYATQLEAFERWADWQMEEHRHATSPNPHPQAPLYDPLATSDPAPIRHGGAPPANAA